MHKSIFDKLLNKSFLLFLLISYVAVLLIPLASGLSMIYTYNKELNNELYKKNHNAAETVCENVIDVIGFADFAYVSILALDDYSIMLRTKNLKGFYHEKGLNIFKQINLDNNNIGLWFIYSKSRNEVLSPIGYYDGEFFFKTYYSGTEFEYEEWTNVLCEQDGKKIFSINKNGKNYLWYNIQMRTPNVGKSDFVLSFLIDSEVFFKNTPYLLGNSRIILSDADKNILYSYSYMDEKESVFSLEKETIINGKKIYITIEFASEAVKTPLGNVKSKIAIGSILTLIAGALFVILAIRKSYSPIKNLLSQLDVQEGQGNEFEKIEKYLKKIAYEKNELSIKIEKNRESESELILQKALSAKLSSAERQILNVIEEGQWFFLVSYEMQAPESFCTNEKLSLLEKYNELTFIISNISGDILQEDVDDIIPIKTENQSLFILRLNDTDNKTKKIIFEKIKFIVDFVNSNFGGICYANISNMQNTIDGLSQAYLEITEKKKKKIVLSQTVLEYNNNDGEDSVNEELNFDIKFYNLFSSRNFEEIRKEILSILSKLKKRSDLSLEVIKGIVFHYVFMVSEMTLMDDERISEEFIDIIMQNSSDIKTAEKFMIERIDLFESKSSKQYKDGVKRLFISDVIAYVDENYTNENLNINNIGLHFGLSPSYVSRIFKEEYGKTLSDIINIKRVEKAKVLLDSPQYRVEDVSQMVGFGSTRSFNRIFKTIVGISPKEFSGRS